MKERIITQSIEGLRREGLKFSVDSVARALNISKKTIYKYFPDKQSLAIAIYQRYYGDILTRVSDVVRDKAQLSRRSLLWIYYDAKLMTSSEIFNKYKLNAALESYTKEQNDRLFNAIYPALGCGPDCDGEALRIIIDGTFEKLCTRRQGAEEVIDYLVKVLT
ncbi:MAG: TetR/AcrR family transcriptional regulator [Candidatus Coproplasma sp.]